MVATPVDRSAVSADGVYRRPPVPFPRAPLSEHDELVWHDGTAPEPCLDRYDHVIAPRRALAMLLSAIGLIYGGAYVVARVVNVASWQPTQPQLFPYNGLAAEFGRMPPAVAADGSDSSSSHQPHH